MALDHHTRSMFWNCISKILFVLREFMLSQNFWDSIKLQQAAFLKLLQNSRILFCRVSSILFFALWLTKLRFSLASILTVAWKIRFRWFCMWWSLKYCKKSIGGVWVAEGGVYTWFIKVILFCLLLKHAFAILDYKCCNTVGTQG